MTLRQRGRSVSGETLSIKSIFKPTKRGGTKHKGSAYDFSINILPVGVIGVGLFVIHMITLLLCPFFGDYELLSVILDSLITYGLSIASSYITVIISSFILLIVERKRIRKVNPFVMAVAILFWPAFILLAAPCDVAALFSKNLAWKTIPHTNTTAIADINLVTK